MGAGWCSEFQDGTHSRYCGNLRGVSNHVHHQALVFFCVLCFCSEQYHDCFCGNVLCTLTKLMKNNNYFQLSCACHTHRHMHHYTLPMSWWYSENKLQLWFWNEMCGQTIQVCNFQQAQKPINFHLQPYWRGFFTMLWVAKGRNWNCRK